MPFIFSVLCCQAKGSNVDLTFFVNLLQDILGTLEAGRQKLDDTLARGDAVLPETSNQGQELIREELNMLTNDFEQFDTDINEIQSNLGKDCL